MKRFLIVLVTAGVVGYGFACVSSSGNAKTAESNFCAARAAYKVFAAAQNGKLDPAPGSARAKLEAEEDKFCAIVGK